jgi:hypothetical protein
LIRPDAAVLGPFSAAMNSYVRGELKFEDDLPYEILAGVQPWNYGARNNYASAGDKLASTMNQNPYMKILVLGGRCDLVCPIDTVHYALDHMRWTPAYRTNITYAEFDAGHMMYINLPDLQKMQKDVENFLNGLRFGGGNHSQPEFGFAGFFAAGADFIFEILFGNRIVGFAVIRAHAGAGTNKLVCQRLRHGIDGDFLCESNDGFAKKSSALFQIERRLFPAVWIWRFFSQSSLGLGHFTHAP